MRTKWIVLVAVATIATGTALGTAYAGSTAGNRVARSTSMKGTAWAVVAGDGTLARHGKHILSADRFNPNGEYEIDFDQDVSQCAATATLGDPNDGVYEIGEVSVIVHATSVVVGTFSSSGTISPKPFHLIVACR
jgi:hypothetical protein